MSFLPRLTPVRFCGSIAANHNNLWSAIMAGSGLKERIRAIKLEVMALAVAAQDTRTPRRAKILLLFLLAYAASPIDLIPDFIPVLGLLDDLVLLPLGIALVVRLTPPAVLHAARARAATATVRPASVAAMVVIVALWLVALAWLARIGWRAWTG